MKRWLPVLLLLVLFIAPPVHDAKHVQQLEDGSLAVIDVPTGHTTVAPDATLAAYATYPRPASLANLQYRQVIEVSNPSGVSMARPVVFTLNLHDVAYKTTLVLTDASGNIIPFQVLSYTDSDGDGRLESATIVFIAPGPGVYFLYYDNTDDTTPIHNTSVDYTSEIYGLTASFNTRDGSSGSLSSSRTGISVHRNAVLQNNATFGDATYGSSTTYIGATITVTVGDYRFIIYASPKYIYQGSFDYDNDGTAEKADAYTFREGLQVIQYRDSTSGTRVDVVRYTPIFSQATGTNYGYTEDIHSPFVFESHAIVLDTDADGDVGNAADPRNVTPSDLQGAYTDPGNPFTVHLDNVTIVLGPVMIAVKSMGFIVPMNVICPNGAVGNNNYEAFTPNFSFLHENVTYVFYHNLPIVELYRKLINDGTSSVRLSDSFSFMDTQPLLHHTNYTTTNLINDPMGYPGDTSIDAATFFQIHTRYDIPSVPPYDSTALARPRDYGLADILGSSPSDKYVYLGRTSEATGRNSTAYPPAMIGMILTKSYASGLTLPDGTVISDPFQTFYSRSVTYGRVYSATSSRYDTDGQYATASIGLVSTDNTGLILNAGGYIEGEVVYAIFIKDQATPTSISNVSAMLKNPMSVSNDPSSVAARESYYNLTVTFVDYSGDKLPNGTVKVIHGTEVVATAVTDSDGSIILKLGANGTYTLEFSFDTVYGTLVQNFTVTRYVNGTSASVTMTAAIQDISIAVSYPDGTPAAGVTVTLYGENSTYTGQTTEALLYNVTLSSGTWNVENLPEGYYRIVITKYFGAIPVVEEHVVYVNATENSFSYVLDVAKVTVTVVDPDGEAIVGASVTLEAYNGTTYVPLYTGTTDTNGQVTFYRVPLENQTSNEPVLVKASYTLYGVTASGSTSIDVTGDVSGSITLNLYDLTINVYDSEGIPAANGTISVTITYADGQQANFEFTGYSYTINDLPSAEYTSNTTITISVTYSIFDVTASGSVSITFTADSVANVTLSDVRSVTFNVGYYDQSGSRVPLSGATIELYTPGGNKLPVTLQTDSNGQATIHGLPYALNYVLHAIYSFYSVPITHVQAFNNTASGETITVAYNVVQIDVYVTATSGETISGATVVVYYGDTKMIEITTGSDGHARYFPFPSSTYINTSLVKVEATYSAYGRPVSAYVTGVDRNSTISITLPLGRIDGTAVLADGRTGIPIHVTVYEASSMLPITSIDALGSFSVPYLPIGSSYVVSVTYVTSYGFAVTVNSSVTLSSTASMSFTIPVGTVGVHVLDKDSNPVAGAYISAAFGPLTVSGKTGTDGYAYFTDVPLSDYVGNVTFNATYTIFGVSVSASVSYSVSNGTVVNLVLDMGSTDVYVYDADGNALAGASVTVTIAGVSQTKSTDSSGKASFYLPVGANATIEAKYTAPNGASASAETSVIVDLSDVQMTLPLGTAYVKVVDYENTPLVGASVDVAIGATTISGTTNSSGIATLYLPLNVNAEIQATYTFAGVPISSTISTTIAHEAVYNVSINLGHVYIKALTYDGTPISGADVYIDVGSIHLAGTTDTEGVAEIYTLVNVTASVTVYFSTFDVYTTQSVFLVAGQSYAFYLPLSSITVIVTDYDGNLISGAVVSLDVLNYHYEGSTTNGSLVIPTVVNATATIKISYKTIYGFTVSISKSVELVRGATYNFTLPLATFKVVVLDSLNEPVQAAKVMLSYQGTIFATAVTDESGSVSIIQTPVGSPISLNVSYETPYGYTVKYFETLTISGPSEKVVKLRMGTLNLQFIDLDGEAYSGFRLTISYESVSVSMNVNTPNVTLEHFPIGVPFNFTAQVSSYGLTVTTVKQISLGAASESYTIVIPLKDITIKVVDYSNRPLAMVKITLSYESTGVFYSTTAMNGELDLEDVPAASYLGSLTVSASYLTTLGIAVEGSTTISSPATTDEISVKLGVKMVKIYAVDVNGEPTQATVYLKPLQGLGSVVLTAANGSVIIPDFPLSFNPVNITAVHTVRGTNGVTLDVSASTVADFTKTSEVRIQLQLTDLDILVTDRNGNPLEGAIVTITVGNLEFKATTNATGIAHFEDIPTLSYLNAKSYHVSIDYGGVVTQTDIAQAGGEVKLTAKTPADVQRQRIIAAVLVTVAVASIVAYKFVLSSRPPYYRLKKAIAKGAEEIDLDRLPTREEELKELFEQEA